MPNYCSRLQAAAVAFGENLPIPEIVAIGGQSDGKSSLLEAFLGVSSAYVGSDQGLKHGLPQLALAVAGFNCCMGTMLPVSRRQDHTANLTTPAPVRAVQVQHPGGGDGHPPASDSTDGA